MNAFVPATMALFLLNSAPSVAQESIDGTVTATNETAFMRLCDEEVKESLRNAGLPDSDSISLTIHNDSVSSFFRQQLIASYRASARQLKIGAESGDLAATCSVASPAVSYGTAFHDGMFGKTLTARRVDLSLRWTIVGSGGLVVSAGTLSRWAIDTIALRDLRRLESGSVSFLRGDPPRATIIDQLAEPLIIIAATGIVVYLFFTIRS